MPLVNAGRDYIITRITGTTGTAFNNANTYLGVGNSATNTSPLTYTDLQGGSKTRKIMDASYPQVSTNTLTFRATFGTSEANHNWQEWGIFNAATGGVMLCRKVEPFGTKPNNETWQLATSIVLTVS